MGKVHLGEERSVIPKKLIDAIHVALDQGISELMLETIVLIVTGVHALEEGTPKASEEVVIERVKRMAEIVRKQREMEQLFSPEPES